METILDLAKEAVENRDRRPPNVVHRRIAAMWSAYLGRAVGPEDVARMMILLKVARDIETPAIDNLVDIAGYARCLEIMRTL